MSANIIAYAVLLIATIYIARIESIDSRCPNFEAGDKECKERGGMAFSDTRPTDMDDCVTLVGKIYKSLGSEIASIKWRRAFVLAVLVMTVMWVLVGTPGTLPEWKTLYLSVIIGFVIILCSFIYYSYHVFGIAEKWAKQSMDKLKEKCLPPVLNKVSERLPIARKAVDKVLALRR